MKKDQKETAKEIMKKNKVNKLYMTSDGQFFLTDNPAQNHALKEHGKARVTKLKVTEVTEAMLAETPKTENKETK